MEPRRAAGNVRRRIRGAHHEHRQRDGEALRQARAQPRLPRGVRLHRRRRLGHPLGGLRGGGGDAVGSARVLFLADDACVPAGVTASRIVRAPEHVLKKAAGLQSVDRVDAVAELSMPPVVGVAARRGSGSNHEAARARRDPGPGKPRHAGAHGARAGMGRGGAAAGDVRSVQRQGEKLRTPGGIFSRAGSAAAPAAPNGFLARRRRRRRRRTICHAVWLDASASDSLISPLRSSHVRYQTF